MAKVCLECFSVFDDMAVNDGELCPKRSCPGKIIEVDELMLPIIIELNKKGYNTDFCCSGHMYEADNFSSPYISFSAILKEYMDPKKVFINLPSGWKLELIDDSEDCIHKGYWKCYLRYKDIYHEKYKDEVALYYEILNANFKLLQWAKYLPDFGEEWDQEVTFDE